MDSSKKNLLIYTGIILAAFVLVVFFSRFLFTSYLYHSGGALLGPGNGENGEDNETENSGDKEQKENRMQEVFGKDTVNIMFLGIDRTWNRERAGRDLFFPDTIMVISLDLENEKINMINVLRDTYVYLPEVNIYDRISNGYVYGHYLEESGVSRHGGIEIMKHSVEHLLGGVPVHYHVAVDLDGAAEIVDALGGVEYELEEPLHDDFGRGEVVVPDGSRRLNGEEFLYLLQYRGSKGDDWRVERQQEIALEVLRQFREDSTLEAVPRAYSILRRNVKTDLSTQKIGELVRFVSKLQLENIHSHVFRGEMVVSERNDREILKAVLDERHRSQVIEEVFDIQEHQRPTYEPVHSRPLKDEENFHEFPSPGLDTRFIDDDFSFQ